jgi:predicted RNA-binding Zn-ribbon protein involved in translation (DUF1610 family)
MANHKSKMICPKCGDEMNHHADKLMDPITAEDREHFNSVLGGMIEEMHCCPGCGAAQSRREE